MGVKGGASLARTLCTAVAAMFFLMSTVPAHRAEAQVSTFPLDSIDGLEVVHAKTEVAVYRGRKAVRLTSLPEREGEVRGPKSEVPTPPDDMLAILKASSFKDGVIEAQVAGSPLPGAPSDARGFIGIAFRVQDDSHYECFYIRPTNGRAEDQLRRNHSAQYVSAPDYPWFRLRKENPGAYESYVDLESGAWTRLKIVVTGAQARLYVNGAEQPALIVNDLKLGETHGRVALWADPTTDAYFSNLTIK
ncbi:MAG: hypothetical protein DMG79_02660 [Acidobacteria bacterium]|nr:MAG: hypothetical protein DMG79_02660 [Acidobacteriota bacterium]